MWLMLFTIGTIQAQEAPHQDTITTYYELINDAGADNGFEKEGAWEGEIISGELSRLKMYFPGDENFKPFEGSLFADMKASDYDNAAAVQITINLDSENTIILDEIDSLLFAFNGATKNAPMTDYWNFRVDISTKNEDTLTYAYGEDIENSEKRKIRNIEGEFEPIRWYEQIFGDIKKFARQYGLENEQIKGLRFYIENVPGTASYNIAELDEIYLHASRDSVTAISEQPTQRLIAALELQSGSIVLSCAVPASTPYTLSIFDVSGREVYSRTDNVSGSGQITCSPMSMSEGVYFWRVATDAGDGAGKFVWVK